MTSATSALSDAVATGQANHPLAIRMATLAFLSFNLTVGCVYGAYGVLIAPIEAKFGITRAVSSLGIPMVMLAIALGAPIVGFLVGKVSIRLLMLTGVVLAVAGYAVLAVAPSFAVFLVAYGLLVGPGMCLLGTMLPPTLVTRWFHVNRGRALGFAHMPILSGAIPPLVALVLGKFGLSTTYVMLACVMGLLFPALLFVVDHPPNAVDQGEKVVESTAAGGIAVGEVLRTGGFWMLTVAFAAISIGAIVLAAHIFPMTTGWGVDPIKAASLLTVSSLGGMAGSVIFGWVADKLGGAMALVILCINNAILWAVLLLQPSYVVIVVIVTLMGLHTAGIVAVISLAFSQRFGPANFGRVFGISNLVHLPLMLSSVPAAGYVFVRTGSYTGAIIGVIGVMLLGAVCALNGRPAKA